MSKQIHPPKSGKVLYADRISPLVQSTTDLPNLSLVGPASITGAVVFNDAVSFASTAQITANGNVGADIINRAFLNALAPKMESKASLLVHDNVVDSNAVITAAADNRALVSNASSASGLIFENTSVQEIQATIHVLPADVAAMELVPLTVAKGNPITDLIPIHYSFHLPRTRRAGAAAAINLHFALETADPAPIEIINEVVSVADLGTIAAATNHIISWPDTLGRDAAYYRVLAHSLVIADESKELICRVRRSGGVDDSYLDKVYFLNATLTYVSESLDNTSLTYP